MKKAKYIIFLILLSSYLYAQDSIKLQIKKVRKSEDRTIYFMKDEQGNRFITQCKCSGGRKKGEWVSIARKDLIIEREVFRKNQLEN